MSIFQKLNEACNRVLKGHNAAAPETKEMTLEEFGVYAAGEIEKATEEKATPAKAVARLKALQLSVAVAESAFETAELEKFSVPVFSAKSAMEQDVMATLAAMNDKITALADGVGKGDDDDADAKKKKADEEAAAAKKTAEDEAAKKKTDDEAAAAKKTADDEAAAKVKADEEAKAAAAKKNAGGGAGDDDEDHDLWPMDLARSVNKRDGDDVYDWGKDPADPADAAGA